MMLKKFKTIVSAMLIMTILMTIPYTVMAADETATEDENMINVDTVQNHITSKEDDNETCAINTEESMKRLQINEIINDPLKGVDDLNNAILKTETYNEGLTVKHETSNVEEFKFALKQKYPEMSDLELGKTILLCLGDTEEFISTLPDEKIVEALEYVSVVKTESFFKQNPDGEKIELSEQDYYDEIALVQKREGLAGVTIVNEEQNNNSMRSYAIYDETETKSSYIKLTSTAYKTNPDYALVGRNYFTIRGEVEWTDTPYYKRNDILAIASSGNVDENTRHLPMHVGILLFRINTWKIMLI